MTLINSRISQGTSQFRKDVLAGLSHSRKTLPCKYFYDEAGSRLFDRICEVDEYYLTRTERQIMSDHAGEMSEEFGPACVLVEYGSGSSYKSRLLLDRLDENAAYVPVDISHEYLRETARELREEYPQLAIRPICADFTRDFEIPSFPDRHGRTIAYFPGSTIGNFAPERAVELLAKMRHLVGASGAALIGVDLPKSRDVLEAAYDDAEGVTAQFNLNLLERINRELDADIPVDQFVHRATFNERESRVEMHLVSTEDQSVVIEGREIAFSEGETIHTESSYKYSRRTFQRLARRAGFQVARIWCDDREYFSVHLLTAAR